MTMTFGSFSDQIQKLVMNISTNRAQIKEDFIEAYLANLPVGDIDVDNILENITLVERWSRDGLSVRWYFEKKKPPSQFDQG